jgi:hypothetical protein
MSVPTFETEGQRLENFIAAVYHATDKRGEVLMRETATPPTVLTDAFKMFRPMLYYTLLDLKAAPHLLALLRVIRECAEEVRAKESPDMRLSNSSLFVVMVAVSGYIGYSVCSAVVLDSAVAKLNGWVLVNKPDGTRVWEME